MSGILFAEQRKQMKNARKFLRRSNLAMHVGSVAIAIESLESLLVEKGILKENELMQRLGKLTQEHYAKDEFISGNED